MARQTLLSTRPLNLRQRSLNRRNYIASSKPVTPLWMFKFPAPQTSQTMAAFHLIHDSWWVPFLLDSSHSPSSQCFSPSLITPGLKEGCLFINFCDTKTPRPLSPSPPQHQQFWGGEGGSETPKCSKDLHSLLKQNAIECDWQEIATQFL